MDRIKGRIVAIGMSETFGISSGALGTTVIDGVTVEGDSGEIEIPYGIAGGRVMTILERALYSGSQAEILLTGPANCRLLYAIRAGGESAYDTTVVARDLWLQALRYLILGTLGLIFVVGAFLLIYAAYLAYRAIRFRPSVSRREFWAGADAPRPAGGEVAVAA